MKPVSLYLWLIAAAIAVASIQCNPTADDRNSPTWQVNLSSEQQELVKIVDNLEKRLPRNGLSSLLTALAADMLSEERFLATEDQTRCWTLVGGKRNNQTSPLAELLIPFEAANCISDKTNKPNSKGFDGNAWISFDTSILNALRRRRLYVMDLCSTDELDKSDSTGRIKISKEIHLTEFRNKACNRFAIDSHRTSLSILDRTIKFSIVQANNPSECLSFIYYLPWDSDRKSIDKLQIEPCEEMEVKKNQKFSIKLTEERLSQLIETLEFQTTFHEAWIERCKLVKPGSGIQDRICLLKHQLGWSNESLEDLLKPMGSLVFNATTRQLNQAVVVDAMSVDLPVNIYAANSSMDTLRPTMIDSWGKIHFILDSNCVGRCRFQPFEWTSLDMRKSYMFGQDKYHRLDLCAKRSPYATDDIYELIKTSVLTESEQSDCTKLALGENYVDDEMIRFKIIQVDNEPSPKCLSHQLINNKSVGSKSRQLNGFRFETCSGIRENSKQVFLLNRFDDSGRSVDLVIRSRIKNFLGPKFGLQYLSLEHEFETLKSGIDV